jgi:hypothetical protein
LWAKGLDTKDIHIAVFPVYGKAVHNWDEKCLAEEDVETEV